VSRLFLLRQLHGQCRQPSGGSRAGDDQPYACQTEWAHRITSRSDGEAWPLSRLCMDDGDGGAISTSVERK